MIQRWYISYLLKLTYIYKKIYSLGYIECMNNIMIRILLISFLMYIYNVDTLMLFFWWMNLVYFILYLIMSRFHIFEKNNLEDMVKLDHCIVHKRKIDQILVLRYFIWKVLILQWVLIMLIEYLEFLIIF
jgi:hypothetical protein